MSARHADIPWFLLEKRTRDAINRILRKWRERQDIGPSEVAAELRAKRPDIAAGWTDLDAEVSAHLRRRWGPR